MPQLTDKDKIFIRAYRSFQGLTVAVKAAPEIEDFFKGLAGDQPTTAVSTISRWWIPPGNVEASDFRVYHLPDDSQLRNIHEASKGVQYRLDVPGSRIMKSDVINLSFLRLVGISSEDGIRFSVAGVYRDAEIDRFFHGFQHACSDFYRSYLKPIDRSITLSVEERTN